MGFLTFDSRKKWLGHGSVHLEIGRERRIFMSNPTPMNIVCIEDAAFYSLVEKIIDCLKEKTPVKIDKWISGAEAMDLLRIKSKTTLQKLRDEGKIRASQPLRTVILYDRDSILDYLDGFAYETFDLR